MMSLGPVMLDISGTALTAADRKLLCHPQVGGVILFTRNYQSIEQLRNLLTEIQVLRTPRLLIAVDHEGGRVQRFRNGFTRLPPVARLGEIYDHDSERALHLSARLGWLMAAELRAVGVDFSFAPVLDLGIGISSIIGDRAFHNTPQGVAALAQAYVNGMQLAGMPATGKHFPGHGSVAVDSHLALPVDDRTWEAIFATDLYPFRELINQDLAGIMPAHVIYPRIDSLPAGFSRFWLQEVLRVQLSFQGVIFSDDLSMGGAEGIGDYAERARVALAAGCDMILICNNREGAITVLEALTEYHHQANQSRLMRMYGINNSNFALQNSAEWRTTVAEINHNFNLV